MSQGPLCPNLSQKVQAEVSQMANRNLSRVILLGGLSVNLNHLKTDTHTAPSSHSLNTKKSFWLDICPGKILEGGKKLTISHG